MLATILNGSTLIFAVSSMLSVGFSFTLRQIFEPLNPLNVLLILLANFLLVPLLAWLTASALSLSPASTIGLMLVASAAGAPLLIKLAAMARSDLAYAAGVLVVLLVSTVAYLSLVIPLVVPGVEVSVLAIASPLAVTMLLPLAIGRFLDHRFKTLGDYLLPLLNKLSTLSLALLLLTTIVANIETMRGVIGTRLIPAGLICAVGAFLIGYVAGEAGRSPSRVTGLATMQRNIAAAMVVATQSFDAPNITVAVVVSSIVSMVVIIPLAWSIGRYKIRAAEQFRELGRERRAPWV